MQQGLSVIPFQADRCTTRGHWPGADRAAAEIRYRRILVSCSPDAADRASLLLGFQLASIHQAALTLLHVAPPAKGGLDALDLLHSAVEDFRRLGTDGRPPTGMQSPVGAFVNEVVPPDLRSAVSWQEARRCGKLAEAIADEVNESGADLVILSTTFFRWWLPRAFDLWTIRRRARASVIIVRDQRDSTAA